MNSDSLDIDALEAQLAAAQPWERLALQRDQLAKLIAAYKQLHGGQREPSEGR